MAHTDLQQQSQPPFLNAAQAAQLRLGSTDGVRTGTQRVKMPFRDLPLVLPSIKVNRQRDCCNERQDEDLLDHQRSCHHFTWNLLAWAIQSHVDPKCIERYLDNYDQSRILQSLLGTISTFSEAGHTFPILYFAAERNSPEIVRMLCQRGADPDRRAAPSGVPVLAYTVMSAEYKLSDTTDTIVALLAMGAKPSDVPRNLWYDYVVGPKNGSREEDKDAGDQWCTAETWEALNNTLNLMQRYLLRKSEQKGGPTPRKKQVAQAHSIMPLFELPYRIIGQRQAIDQVEENIGSHFLFNTAQPLVLLFTGPSGHGKTELASSLGDLLSIPFLAVDCSLLHHSTDLLGTHAGHEGWEQGSPLSTHLAQHAGRKNVVFLDEFEKTTEDVRQSLLLLFEGKYTNRRNNESVDCAKCIWVLAANLGLPAISQFWDDHLKDRSEEQQTKAPFKKLQNPLGQTVKRELGLPLARRLTDIVPFLPFSKDEQAVATYKFMRNLWQDVRKPINVQSKEFIRNIFLDFVDDGQIANHLATQYYDPQAGASSVLHAVDHEIRQKLAKAWYREKERIVDEMMGEPLPVYDVTVVTTSNDDSEVAVKRTGTRTLKLRPETS